MAEIDWMNPFFCVWLHSLKEGLRFEQFVGLFRDCGWPFGYVAKVPIEPPSAWFAMEWYYIALQFSFVGVAFGLIHGNGQWSNMGPY